MSTIERPVCEASSAGSSMLFHSVSFVLFFAVVLAVQGRLRHRAQNLFLLAASLFFYGSWNARLLWLIVGSATLDYVASLAIERSTRRKTAKRWMLASVTANLTLLGIFKYAGFFVESFVALLHTFGVDASGPALHIILPVGISFYTFQSMSYTIDVYRGDQRACRSYTDFLLYVSFFPQLVAGPIERASRLLPQIENPREPLKRGDVVEGIHLILVGIVQKVFLADALAVHVDRVFSDPTRFDSLTLLLGLWAFAVQIYCDFSGYSKMARGIARLIGFRLVRNFAEPYFSASITEFWRRWHISLSAWLRDYLYIPLGGNRRGPGRTYLNLMLTMLLGGLWHGASWNFVIWGGLHGLFLAVHRALGRKEPGGGPARRAASVFLTFQLTCLAWIFFRAQGFSQATDFLRGLLAFTASWSDASLEIVIYLVLCFALDVLLRRRARGHLLFLFSRNWALETALISLLLLLSLLVGENHVVPFVYFQF